MKPKSDSTLPEAADRNPRVMAEVADRHPRIMAGHDGSTVQPVKAGF